MSDKHAAYFELAKDFSKIQSLLLGLKLSNQFNTDKIIAAEQLIILAEKLIKDA